MTRRALYIALAVYLLFVTGCATANPFAKPSSAVNVLTGIDMQDYSVEFKLEKVFTSSFTVYKPSDPYTVVVELPDVELGDLPDKMESEKKGIREIKFFSSTTPANYTRVEILLDSPVDVIPRKAPNSLIIDMEGPSVDLESVMAEGEVIESADIANVAGFVEEAYQKAPPLEEMEIATAIIDITFDFSGETVKFIITGNGAIDAKVFTLPGRIVVDVPGVTMDTTAPETVLAPIKGVRVGKHDNMTRIVLDVEDDVEFIASARKDKVMVSIPVKEEPLLPVEKKKPRAVLPEGEAGEEEDVGIRDEDIAAMVAEEEEAAEVAKRKYTGQLVSLDFQDADVIPIFRFLGDIGGYNVVIHPTVSGRVTLKLKNVPWDQALDIILELSNLGMSKEDNILRIAPTSVFTSQKEEAARLAAAAEKVAPLVQEAISLRFISAADMLKRLNEAKALSPRGTARIDERTNTLILNDTQETIDKIKGEEIPYWDTAEHGTMQVLIEAKIVQVSTDTARSLGIRWGASATSDNLSFVGDQSEFDMSVNTPISPAGAYQIAPGGILNIGYTETATINMSLEALESVNKVKKLANPRLITIDKTLASIKQGVQIPFSTVSSEGTKTEFQEATLSLEVTPEIQPNGMLRLEVKANNDTPVAIGEATGINTQAIQTQALVKDGQTLVLGGIYTNTEQENVTGIPFLSKIPIIGWFFKTRSSTTQPSELLIFITPKVVR